MPVTGEVQTVCDAFRRTNGKTAAIALNQSCMNPNTPITIPPELIGALRQARHVLVFTGAGVSAESGIPTFRDALTGLWERYDPAELATAEAFQDDPALVWGWYEWRRMKVLLAQ